MATHYPIVFEREDSGVYSAYVGGLPVYAHGATHAKTASAIVRTLRAYLDAHPQGQPRADVRVAKVWGSTRGRGRSKVSLVTAAALVGRRTSERRRRVRARTGAWAGARARCSPNSPHAVSSRSASTSREALSDRLSSRCSPIAPKHGGKRGSWRYQRSARNNTMYDPVKSAKPPSPGGKRADSETCRRRTRVGLPA